MIQRKLAIAAIVFFIVSSAAFLAAAALHGTVYFFFVLGIIGFIWGIIFVVAFVDHGSQNEFDAEMEGGE